MRVEPWLMRAAARGPDRPAVQTPRGLLTYAQLADAARVDLPRGERVAIALPAGLDFAVALHACLLSGAVAVPVDLRSTPAEQDRLRRDCALTIDAPLQPDGSRPDRHDLDAPAVVIHTSGTSGEAKAVELTYGNWLWSALGSATAIGFDANERWLCTLPLSHVGGLSILIRSAIYGTTAILHERFDAGAALAALPDATVVSLVPTTLTRLLDAGLRDPRRLRCVLLGGAPATEELLERAREAGVPVAQTYGLTEACSQVTTQSPGEIGDDAGPALFCTDVRIADDGEILVSGPTVAPSAGKWLATGDIGEVNRSGALRVTGRKADLIVSGGENVSPFEVEAVIASHPAVREVAVIGVAHADWGEALRAIVVLEAPTDAEEIRAHCAARLAGFKVPKEIVFAGEPLPRTRSGKLLRRALK